MFCLMFLFLSIRVRNSDVRCVSFRSMLRYKYSFLHIFCMIFPCALLPVLTPPPAPFAPPPPVLFLFLSFFFALSFSLSFSPPSPCTVWFNKKQEKFIQKPCPIWFIFLSILIDIIDIIFWGLAICLDRVWMGAGGGGWGVEVGLAAAGAISMLIVRMEIRRRCNPQSILTRQ